MKRSLTVFLMLSLLVIAACGPTGDTTSDAESAQSLLPNITGYTVNSVDNVIDGFTAAVAGSSAVTGNAPLAAGIVKAEAVVQCLQDTGAIAAQTYTETSPANFIPEVGLAFVVNQTRIADNILSCVAGANQGVSAQSIAIEPCIQNGSFTFNGDNVSYFYMGVGDSICGFFNQHFTNLSS